MIKRIVICAVMLSCAAGAALAAAPTMESSFRAQDWRAMDAIFARVDATSNDFFPKTLTERETSLYVNALWRQSKWADAVALMERFEQDGRSFPPTIAPYASMLRVLGLERTQRPHEAMELGTSLWADASPSVRYYLAFAMGRVARSLGKDGEALEWFRRMLELAPDKKSRQRALEPMLALPGITADEAATALIDSPASAAALSICSAVQPGANSRVDYAIGYHAYLNKKYDTALSRLSKALNDPKYAEDARYWCAYAAFRKNDFGRALDLWSWIALNGSEYPQRSVARLTTLAGKANKEQVIAVLKKAADSRTDYPEVAADALASLVKIGSQADASWAREKLYSAYSSTPQAAGARWDEGWALWKKGDISAARERWAAGWTEDLKDRELASRLLYWQARALDRLKSPEAAAKMRSEVLARYPGEYYAFMIDRSGGMTNAPLPASFDVSTELEEWGFITYARLEAAAAAQQTGDAGQALRSARLAAWEGDWSSSVRAFAPIVRSLPAHDLSSSELMRICYPRAFEPDVSAATKRTGLAPEYIWSIMRQESMYEPDVTSSAGAYGLMQLMPATAAGEEKKMKMPARSYLTPQHNIMLGANHFVGLMAAYEQNAHLALAAYNAGGGRVKQWTKNGFSDIAAWTEDIPFKETRGYVKAVMKNYGMYRTIYRLAGGK